MKPGDRVRLTEDNALGEVFTGLTAVVTDVYEPWFIHATLDDNENTRAALLERNFVQATLKNWPFEPHELECAA